VHKGFFAIAQHTLASAAESHEKDLGRFAMASRLKTSVTAALAELGLELELSGWAPWLA
jgi:hypothetical protein